MSDDKFHCPSCGGYCGHIIDCPEGIRRGEHYAPRRKPYVETDPLVLRAIELFGPRFSSHNDWNWLLPEIVKFGRQLITEEREAVRLGGLRRNDV